MIPKNSMKFAVCAVLLPFAMIRFLAKEERNLERNNRFGHPERDLTTTTTVTTNSRRPQAAEPIQPATSDASSFSSNVRRRGGDGVRLGGGGSPGPVTEPTTVTKIPIPATPIMYEKYADSSSNDDYVAALDFYDQLDPILHEDGVQDDDVAGVGSQPQQEVRTRAIMIAEKKESEGKMEEEDPLIHHNSDLTRARPRHLRLVFIGDSITRYQYLSMAYWLRYGRWFDPTTYPNNLMNAHSFHHTYHPNEDWNEFFMQSNRMLQPMELCDCVRRDSETKVAIERRYFRDDERNNTLVYINVSGKSTLGHAGLYGRVNPETVFSQNQPFHGGLLPEQNGGLLPKQKDDSEQRKEQEFYSWEYSSWGDLIRYHIGPMALGPSAVAVLNAGLHPNRFHDTLYAVALEVALEDVGIQGIWKTTTFTKEQLLTGNTAVVNEIDRIMCLNLMMDCFNLKWMHAINPNLYYDQLHFNEPVYRILNEELLAKLELLPVNYQRLERSVLF